MKRRIRKILLVLILLPVLLIVGLRWYVESRLQPEKLVASLEADRNCRAEVGSASLSLFSFPARLEIDGLRLLPRDKEVDKPLAERKPAKSEETLLAVPKALVEVDLWALLRGSAAVKNLRIENAEVKSVRKKNGENTLRTLLAKRKDPNAPAAPKGLEDPDKEVKQKPFNAKDLALSPALDSAVIENAVVVILNEKKRRSMEFSGLNLSLSDVALDSDDLAKSNRATLKAGTRLRLENLKTGVRQVDLLLDAGGKMTPFDPKTGNLNTSADFDLMIHGDSFLDRIPTLEKLAKRLALLKDKIGLDLTSFPVSGKLEKDTPVKLRAGDGKMVFVDDVNLVFDTCRIKLKKDGWWELSDQSHEFQGTLFLNEAVTKDALAGVNAYLKAKNEKLAEIAGKTILTKLVNDKGLLAIPFVSTGDIGDPDVNLSKSFEKDLTKALADAAKELLIDAVQGGGQRVRSPQRPAEIAGRGATVLTHGFPRSGARGGWRTRPCSQRDGSARDGSGSRTGKTPPPPKSPRESREKAPPAPARADACPQNGYSARPGVYGRPAPRSGWPPADPPGKCRAPAAGPGDQTRGRSAANSSSPAR